MTPRNPNPGPPDQTATPLRVGLPAAEGPSAWNLANALTVLRLLIVPVFGWCLVWGDGHDTAYRWAAFALFAVAMITDRIDGDLARRRNSVTNFGKVADPIADKALVSTALIGLSAVGDVPWWITVLVLVREWGITAVRFWVIRHGVMAAGRGGKVKTLLQALGLGFMIWPRWDLQFEGLWNALAWGLLWAAVLVTVVTGIDYVIQALRLRQTSPRALAKRAAREARRQGRSR